MLICGYNNIIVAQVSLPAGKWSAFLAGNLLAAGPTRGVEVQRAQGELDISGRRVARLSPDFESKLLLGCLHRGSALGSLTWWPEHSMWRQAHGGTTPP